MESGVYERTFPKEKLFIKKLGEARVVLARCIGEKGVWASGARYRDMCWTRDLAMSIPALVREGHESAVRHHLEELMERQGSSGKIPVYFLDNVSRWLWRQTREVLTRRRASFFLLRFFRGGNGIVNISPWTKDSELMFVIGMYEYVLATGDTAFAKMHHKSIDIAFQYIEKNLLKYGLLCGADWRDTSPELEEKALLGLNCLLYWAYMLNGQTEKARIFSSRIHGWFWMERAGYYRDHKDTKEFDVLGNALALYYDIGLTEPAHYLKRVDRVLEKFASLESPYGYLKWNVPLPPIAPWEKEIMKRVDTDGLIFPFLTAYGVRVAYSAGANLVAQRGFEKLLSLEGNYEWYDPRTGNGGGSPDQLWTAATFLDAAHFIKDDFRYQAACF